MSKDDARKGPKFPWDYDVPNDPFWENVEYKVARNFLQNFSKEEISQMKFDSTLSLPSKLQYLLPILTNTLSSREAKVAPLPLHDVDYHSWNFLKLGQSTMFQYLGDYSQEEKIVREMYENGDGPHGTKSMSALHMLSGIMEVMGRYGEAEEMAKEVLPWMRGHEMLGRDSPQALGCMFVVLRSVWKQRKWEEAEEWKRECRETIEGMGKGKFGKYQADEREQLEELERDLEKWREEHGKE